MTKSICEKTKIIHFKNLITFSNNEMIPSEMPYNSLNNCIKRITIECTISSELDFKLVKQKQDTKNIDIILEKLNLKILF